MKNCIMGASICCLKSRNQFKYMKFECLESKNIQLQLHTDVHIIFKHMQTSFWLGLRFCPATFSEPEDEENGSDNCWWGRTWKNSAGDRWDVSPSISVPSVSCPLDSLLEKLTSETVQLILAHQQFSKPRIKVFKMVNAMVPRFECSYSVEILCDGVMENIMLLAPLWGLLPSEKQQISENL